MVTDQDDGIEVEMLNADNVVDRNRVLSNDSRDELLSDSNYKHPSRTTKFRFSDVRRNKFCTPALTVGDAVPVVEDKWLFITPVVLFNLVGNRNLHRDHSACRKSIIGILSFLSLPRSWVQDITDGFGGSANCLPCSRHIPFYCSGRHVPYFSYAHSPWAPFSRLHLRFMHRRGPVYYDDGLNHHKQTLQPLDSVALRGAIGVGGSVECNEGQDSTELWPQSAEQLFNECRLIVLVGLLPWIDAWSDEATSLRWCKWVSDVLYIILEQVLVRVLLYFPPSSGVSRVESTSR
jgi:hypothetical protein